MCGLIGTIGFSKSKLLDLKTIAHRGPDAFGTWVSPNSEFPVELGHVRLSILDLSENGRQPFLTKDGRYIFVFNGEIYNFIELRKRLEEAGHQFFTETDTEVFLHGLIEEGPSFQLRCNGMWAFCLWDRLTNTALFGRDRFGKKPLFYSELGSGQLVFASEMKAIYPFLSSVEPSDRVSLHLQHIFDFESTEECTVKGIKRLPPGHFAHFENGRIILRRWWNTLDHLEQPPLRYEDQVEKWRELFLDAVKIRMRADVRIGTALSGGLDSSAIFSAMALLAGQSVTNEREANDWQHGFCAHYPNNDLDETHWAKIVTDQFGLPLQKVEVDPVGGHWSVLDALRQVEDPYLTLPTPMLETYRAISQAGIKVTLDGHGADELFSGYGHLKTAYKSAGIDEARELYAIIQSLTTGKLEFTGKGVFFAKHIKQRILAQLRSGLRQPKNILKALLGISDLEFINYKLQFEDQSDPRFRSLDPLTQDLYEIFHVTVLPTLLRNYDRYSMASGLEIRMPFMDYRLVSYTFSLPWTSKVGGGFTKRIMRDALKGILPEEIRCRRDKIGWNAPLHEWLRGPLKTEIEKTLRFDEMPIYIKYAWWQLQENPNPNFMHGQKVWNLLMPLLWKKAIFSAAG
jgi:asparagine synthase (glutamine-hydrolysing)